MIEDPAEGARPTRNSLFLRGILTRPSQFNPLIVRVRNLSSGGAMVEGDSAVAVGERVELELSRIGTIVGRVAWVRAGQIGIAFDEPIDPSMALRPVVRRS